MIWCVLKHIHVYAYTYIPNIYLYVIYIYMNIMSLANLSGIMILKMWAKSLGPWQSLPNLKG